MKTQLKIYLTALSVIMGSSLNTFGHSQTNVVPASAKAAFGWQGASTTVGNMFSGNTIPDGTTLYFWNVSSQGYDIVSYTFGAWNNANYTVGPGQGFLIEAGSANKTFVFSGSDLAGTNTSILLESNKWYLISHQYPREGWLEKNPSPYSPGCYLNFPGRLSSDNNSAEDKYYRWSLTLQDWVGTQRSSDSPDPENLTGGYANTNQFGARWRPPGSTTGYQGNGVADNWIYLSEPIFYIHHGTNRTWNFYKNNDPYATCP